MYLKYGIYKHTHITCQGVISRSDVRSERAKTSRLPLELLPLSLVLMQIDLFHNEYAQYEISFSVSFMNSLLSLFVQLTER